MCGSHTSAALGVMGMVGVVMLSPLQAQPAAVLTLQTDEAVLAIGADATVQRFADRRSGDNVCAQPGKTPLARLTKDGKEYAASAAALSDGLLTVQFGEAAVTARLEVTAAPHWFVLGVRGLSPEAGVTRLVFLDLPLALKGAPSEAFAACALALNLQTQVRAVPQATNHLWAACYPRFGFAGARVAVVGCAQANLRQVLKDVVTAAPELPHSPLGGPWALEGPENNGSYLFNTHDLSQEKADQWIELARSLGITQIDFHGGTSFRFGDCRPNPVTYPRGTESMKAVLDRLHSAGILAGLHTYAMFIDKTCPWVTPVPDPRLGTDAVFTLAADLPAEGAEVPVQESTGAMSTVTGFFVRNSVTLRIDDELIEYRGLRQEPPYAFTECKRGACGTKVSAHAKGAAVHHLRECFGRFVPDGESTLFTEVAAKTAELYNAAGFDMIYLDALDGGDTVAGREYAWHYESKFTFEIWKRLNRPAIMEMSTFHHHLWYVRSRMGAWDHPTRSHKKFIDIHCAANANLRRQFLPGHLGWWAFMTWAGVDTEPTYADDIEYLCAKALGHDTGLSILGITPENVGKVPALPRLAGIVRQYECLRQAGYFSDAVKAALREPGAEFALFQGDDGEWQFRPVEVSRHTVSGAGGSSHTWRAASRFGPQAPWVRIEALYAVKPYDDAEGIALAEFSGPEEFPQRAAQPRVEGRLDAVTDVVKAGGRSGRFTAANGTDTATRAWCKQGRTFTPPLDLGGRRGLGLWVYGDGQGEVLNLQQTSPAHLSHGIADHYVTIDFTGWRYIELVEPEGARHAEYSWPYGGNYAIYRESLRPAQLETFSLWYNNLPPKGKVGCHLSPIRALPVAKAVLHHPSLAINGQRLTFPVDIETGQALEFRPPSDCRLFGPQGEELAQVTLTGPLPTLVPGDNVLAFSCSAPGGLNPRARVSVGAAGEPMRGTNPPERVRERFLSREEDAPRLVRALDGVQNQWDVICRPTPQGATLEAEIAVEAIGEPGSLYADPRALTVAAADDLAGFADQPANQYLKYVVSGALKGVSAAPGVSHELGLSPEAMREGRRCLRYQAASEKAGGWSARGKRFDPPLDLSAFTHIGFPIHGDGNGEVLYLQLRDAKGGNHDMKVGIGFEGWKYREFSLAGTTCDLSAIEYLIVYYNGLPAGKTCVCHLGDVRALRDASQLQNPSLTVAGSTLTFPVAIPAGSRLVFRGMGDCAIYGPDGQRGRSVVPVGAAPALRGGRQRVTLGLADADAAKFQLRVKTTKVYGP